MCVFVVCADMHPGTGMEDGERSRSPSLYLPLLYFLETGSIIGSEAHQFGSADLSVSSMDLPATFPPGMGLQACTAMTNVNMDARDSNPDPHACEASALTYGIVFPACKQ